MFFEKDYVMRMVRLLAVSVARIIRAEQNDDPDELKREIENAYASVLGTPSALWKRLDVESIKTTIRDPVKLRALAVLFIEEANASVILGEPEECASLLGKARSLLEDVDADLDGDFEIDRYRKRIAKIEEMNNH